MVKESAQNSKDGSHNQGLFAHLYMLHLVEKGLICREYGASCADILNIGIVHTLA